SVQARERKGRERRLRGREIARKERGEHGHVAIGMPDRKLAEHGLRVPLAEREPRGGAACLEALPQRPRWKDDVPLEALVHGGVGAREEGVHLVDDLAHLRELAVDLPPEQLEARRHLETESVTDHREHRVERAEATT